MSGLAQYFRPSAWVLEPAPSKLGPSSRWSNKDMDPVPPKLRTWTTFNYVAYWISDAANVPAWELASSMLAVGLSWSVFRVLLAVSDVNLSPCKIGDRRYLLSLWGISSLQLSWF